MTMQYYILSNNRQDFEEVTREEYIKIIGEPPCSMYALQVYEHMIDISEVPEEYRETVEAIVSTKIEKYGECPQGDIENSEFMDMLEEIL